MRASIIRLILKGPGGTLFLLEITRGGRLGEDDAFIILIGLALGVETGFLLGLHLGARDGHAGLLNSGWWQFKRAPNCGL